MLYWARKECHFILEKKVFLEASCWVSCGIVVLKLPGDISIINAMSHPANVSGSVEAISKIGFWLKVKAGPSFNPQAYSSMSRS
jgi:hypothetical protein